MLDVTQFISLHVPAINTGDYFKVVFSTSLSETEFMFSQPGSSV